MKAVIYPNFQKKNALHCARAVCDTLHAAGMELYTDLAFQKQFADKPFVQYGDFPTLVTDADFAIAIGGDGTILKCAGKMYHSDAKLLGINTGHLGFMAALEYNELDKLSVLLDGSYRISNRMMLRTKVTGDPEERVFHALNDVYASRLSGRISDFSVYVDSHLIGQYRADGVVFSTPTGSTAYSLSAGGPIIEPEIACIEMTLICPHSLFARPMLFSANRSIRLEHSGEDCPELFVSVDGKTPILLQYGQAVEITRATHMTQLIDRIDGNFYDTLNGKLMKPLKETEAHVHEK